MHTLLSLLLVALSIVGIADASYLTYEKIAGIVPPCSPGFNCEAVLTSEWASIGPIPLSVFGILFYVSVFVLAVMQFLEVDIVKTVQKITKKLGLSKSIFSLLNTQEILLLLTTFGLLFSAYLLFIMGVIIQSWCTYCLVSAGTSFLLWLTNTIRYQIAVPNSPFILKKSTFFVIALLYQNIIKSICFLFDAEKVHNNITKMGAMLGMSHATRALTHWMFGFTHTANKKILDGIAFPSVVGLAAGFDYNGNLTGIIPSVSFGFHTIGTVTYGSYAGNTPPRLGRFVKSKSLLVNKGLKSIGAHAVIAQLGGRPFAIPTGISIASTNAHFDSIKAQILDILQAFKLFEASDCKHAYYELNISCPNTFGGEPFTSPERLQILLHCLDALHIKRPIYVKMPIDQSNAETEKLLEVINDSSISGVIFGNLAKNRAAVTLHPDDAKTWQTVHGNVSGKPTWKRSNELIVLTKKLYKNRFTIIGTGGIFSAEDALHKLSLGADLVQLITGMIFQGPQLIGSINLKTAQENSIQKNASLH